MPKPQINQPPGSVPDPNATTNSARLPNVHVLELHLIYFDIVIYLAEKGILSYAQAAQIFEEIWHEWPTECRPSLAKLIEAFWRREDLCSRRRDL